MKRRHFLFGLAAAVAVPTVTLPYPAGDVWLGFRGENRTALKRVVYSRVYGAGSRQQREFGGPHMPAQSAVLESERRLYALHNTSSAERIRFNLRHL